MSLRLRPAKERIEDRVTELKESSEANRLRSALYLGATMLNGFGIVLNTLGGNKILATINGVVTVGSAAAALHAGLDSNSESQEAAALEGALAQHELAATPYQVEDESYFVQDN